MSLVERVTGCRRFLSLQAVLMLEEIAVSTAHGVTRVVELTGVAIIAVGAFGTLLLFLYRFASGYDRDQAVSNLRSSLGRAILLGLEFLVAADIINTVAVQPTLGSVAVLAGIVVIRTFLSFSLETEIEGRLPWRRGAAQREV
ncbi:DUF1622 domain-containing protein [Sphingomonas flavescens]|uniref:DUF1622 domain-containing protein n=1 Tax=Sphingomonas flavescens TaxID=3132797 RepID=UPI002805D394|nr:DUF1622 domain-containing protein [Sphingomonas limnosediminicola]